MPETRYWKSNRDTWVPVSAGVVALVLLAGGAASCDHHDASGTEPDPLAVTGVPREPADIRGSITLVHPGDSVMKTGGTGNPNQPVSCPPSCDSSGPGIRSVLIEETPGGHGDDKSYVKVPHTARVFRKSASGITMIGFTDLRVGQKIEAWFTGPVAESYPTQATAAVILVMP